MGILDNLRKRREEKLASRNAALGPVFLKPSEATPEVISKITSQGSTVTVGSGSAASGTTTSYVPSRGSSRGYVQTSTPAQTQLELEKNRIREEELRRQEELKKLEEIKNQRKKDKILEEIKNQRAAEVIRLQNLQRKEELERGRKLPTTIASEIKKIEDRLTTSRGVYVPPTDKFGKSQQYYLEKDLNSYADKLVKELQAEVNKGNISVDKANEILKKNIENKYNQIISDLEKKYPKPLIDYTILNELKQFRLNKLNRELEKLEKKEGRFERLKSKTYNVRDFILGGRVTNNALDREQNKLAIEIEKYNLKYGNKNLSESEYKQANKELENINSRAKKIDEKRLNLENTFKSKIIGSFLWGEGKFAINRINDPNTRARIERQLLNELDRAEKELKKSTNLVDKKILKREINQINSDLNQVSKGFYPLRAGYPLPIIPAATIPPETFVSFGGTSKAVGNVRITSVSFTQMNKLGRVKQIGDAKIYTLGSGKKTFSITIGNISGRGKGISKIIGIEGALSTAQKTAIKTQILKLTHGGKQLSPLQLTKILEGIKTSASASKGITIVSKMGYYVKNLNPRLRPYMNIDVDSFVSFSKNLTAKQISILSGLTKSSSGSMSKFLGIIKEITKGGSGGKALRNLSPAQLKQFQQALSKLTGAFTAAVNSVKRTNPTLRIATVNARALANIKKNISTSQLKKVEPILKPTTQKNVLKEKLTLKKIEVPTQSSILNISSSKSKTKVKEQLIEKEKEVIQKIKDTQKNIQKINQRIKVLQRIKFKQKSQQKTAQRQLQILRNAQKTSQRQLQSLKYVQKLIQRQLKQLVNLSLRGFGSVRRPLRIRRIKKKDKPSDKKVLSKPVKVYSVYAKKRGKNVILKSNLKEKDARDFLAYALDNQLLRQGFIKEVGKRKIIAFISPKEKGYFTKVKRKLRPYKIVRRNKKPIRGFIEKTRYIMDRPGERIQSSRLKRTTRRTPIRRTTIKRKITPSQRKELLRRLAKAREVRMRNLRRRNGR